MLNIKQELETIHRLIHKAYYQCNVLKTVLTVQDEATPQFNRELDVLVRQLEKTVLHARTFHEACYIDTRPLEKVPDYEAHWSRQAAVGTVEVDENGWLHICLHTLLPHCGKQANRWLRDTLSRLLQGYRQSGQTLPYFERAMLVIDEHCSLESRQVFDQDNKSWKVIPNVLKGLVIADDDQHSLGISLVSTWSDTPACHIHVMDIVDAGAYFSFFSGDYGSYFHR